MKAQQGDGLLDDSEYRALAAVVWADEGVQGGEGEVYLFYTSQVLDAEALY